MTTIEERNKATVRRLINEVINGGQLQLIGELYAPGLIAAARAWIAPFRASFPDVRMDIIQLIAEEDTVAGRFTCSATHTGTWLGYPPTGRRFEHIDEAGIYQLRDARIIHAWTLEDNLTRLRHLGLLPPHPPSQR